MFARPTKEERKSNYVYYYNLEIFEAVASKHKNQNLAIGYYFRRFSSSVNEKIISI